MAKKDEDDKKDEDEKKAKAKSEAKDDDKEEESSDVEVEVDGEEKKQKQEAKDEEKVEEVVEESEEEKEERLSKSQQRKQRQRDAREQKEREIIALKAQNAELATRVRQIEERGFNADVSNVDRGLYEAQSQMEEAKSIIAKAAKENNGEALASANEAYYEARRRAEQLYAVKQGLAQKAQEPKQQTADPLLVRHAKDWMSKNRWYDPRGFDQDSKIALSIDSALAADGWDPRTPEYWEEFSERVAKYLPHRITAKKREEEDDDDDAPASQTRGSGRESAGGSASKTTFRVSKDRVDALKEAGQWDDFQKDPKFRARMIRRFKEADEKHASK